MASEIHHRVQQSNPSFHSSDEEQIQGTIEQVGNINILLEPIATPQETLFLIANISIGSTNTDIEIIFIKLNQN